MVDLIHKTPRGSIYVQSEYLVNSDMSIPLALAAAWNFGVVAELRQHIGIPGTGANLDRAPIYSPVVLHQPRIPEGR